MKCTAEIIKTNDWETEQISEQMFENNWAKSEMTEHLWDDRTHLWDHKTHS